MSMRSRPWRIVPFLLLVLALAMPMVPALAQDSGSVISIDTPSDGQSADVGSDLVFRGWAANMLGPGTGVDRVIILDAPQAAGGITLAEAIYGAPRPDVAQAYGAAWTNVAYTATWRVTGAPGNKTFWVYAHSPGNDGWTNKTVTVRINAPAPPPPPPAPVPTAVPSSNFNNNNNSNYGNDNRYRNQNGLYGNPCTSYGYSGYSDAYNGYNGSYGGGYNNGYYGGGYNNGYYGGGYNNGYYGSGYNNGYNSPYYGNYGNNSNCYGNNGYNSGYPYDGYTNGYYGNPYVGNPYVGNPYLNGNCYGNYNSAYPYYNNNYYGGLAGNYNSYGCTGYSPYTNVSGNTVVATVASDGTVVLSWTIVPYAVQYRIYELSPNNIILQTVQASGFSGLQTAQLTGLPAGTAATFQVRAVANGVETPIPATWVTSGTTTTTVAAPTNVSVASKTANSVTLAWTPSSSSNVTAYQIFFSTSASGPFNPASVTAAGSSGGTVVNLGAGTYYFQVLAYQGSTASAPSATVGPVTVP